MSVEIDLRRRQQLVALALDRLRLTLDDDVQLSTQALDVTSDVSPRQRSLANPDSGPLPSRASRDTDVRAVTDSRAQ
jgi:hypothetical protein